MLAVKIVSAFNRSEDMVAAKTTGFDRRWSTHKEERQEEKDLASTETTLNLFYPGVVVCHPNRAAFDRDIGWLRDVPVELSLPVLPCEAKHVKELRQDRASRWTQDVILAVQEENDRSGHEEDGRKQESCVRR